MGSEEAVACALTLAGSCLRRPHARPQRATRALGLRPGLRSCIPLPTTALHPPRFPPAGPRYDTRTIVWICLTLITGLVALLLLLICKKRWVVLGPSHPQPLSWTLCLLPVLSPVPGAGLTYRGTFLPSWKRHSSLAFHVLACHPPAPPVPHRHYLST